MKQYLPLFALAFTAAQAQAAQWTEPTVRTSADFALSTTAQGDTTYVYLYHAGRGQFLAKGASYGTRAALDSTHVNAHPYAIFQEAEGYRLFSPNAAYQGMLFRESSVNVYTDYNNNGGSTRFWAITPQANGTYRLSSPAADATWGQNGTSVTEAAENTYLLGWNPDTNDLDGSNNNMGTNQAVYMLDPTLEGIEVDWHFVSAADYEQYQALRKLYTQLNAAEQAGVATANAESIYNNATASVAEIEAAVEALKQAMANKIYADASEDNPADITAVAITNADFSAGSLEGWTADTGVLVYSGDSFPNSSCNTQEYNNYETFSKAIAGWVSSSTSLGDANVHQTISGLPAGKYVLTLSLVAQHAADMPSGVFLYANGITENQTECKHDAAFWEQLVAAGTYNQLIMHPTVEFVHMGGDITIGLKLQNTNCNWVYADNFKLTYYGPTAESPYLLALKSSIDAAEKYTDTEAYYYSLATEALLSQAIQNAEALLAASATDEELTNGRNALEQVVSLVRTEAAAYASLASHYQQVEADRDKYQSAGLSTMAERLADLYDELLAHYDDRDYTTEQINAAINAYPETINQLLAEAMADATEDTPVEVTSLYMENPDFSQGSLKGWTTKNGVLVYSGDKFPNSSCNTQEYNNYETFSKAVAAWVSSSTSLKDEQLTQVIKDLPKGSYVLSCSMVAQHGADMPSGVYLYTNGAVETTTECKHDATLWEQLVAAGTTNQLIMHPRHVFYHMGGDLELGLRLAGTNCNWVYADNFTLSYAGVSINALYQAMQAMAEQARELQDAVMTVERADQLLNDALDASENTTATDEEAINATMSLLQEAIAYAKESQTLTSRIQLQYELYNDYLIAEVESDDQQLPELLTEIGTAIADGFASNEQIQAFLTRLPATYTAYVQHPVLTTASEAQPGDISKAVFNANFEGLYGGSAADYWDITREGGTQGSGSNAYEMYNNTSFNVQQTVTGLADGYYRVRLQGYYRAGSNAANTASQTADPTSGQNVSLFANNVQVPLANVLSAGSPTAYGVSGETRVAYNGLEAYYIPNSMSSAATYFEDDRYWNQLDVKVEGGQLTIGLRKNESVADDWTIWNKFELLYLGTTPPTAIESVSAGTSEAAVTSTTYYSIDGTRQSRLLKGVNIIKTTLADGSVRIQKVLVR